MKKLNPLLFIAYAFMCSTLLFSCSSKKIGFFNHTTSYPYVKESEQNDFADNTSAAAERKNQNQEKNFAYVINAPIQKEVSKPSSQVSSSEKVSITSTPISERKLNKEKRKEVKKYIKENLKSKVNNESDINVILLVIIAILLPPVAVLLVDGVGGPFFLSILLWLLFYFPGLIYALYRIFKN
jgi:uncharacterized membrane protein YqaE (UPF0057 family)